MHAFRHCWRLCPYCPPGQKLRNRCLCSTSRGRACLHEPLGLRQENSSSFHQYLPEPCAACVVRPLACGNSALWALAILDHIKTLQQHPGPGAALSHRLVEAGDLERPLQVSPLRKAVLTCFLGPRRLEPIWPPFLLALSPLDLRALGSSADLSGMYSFEVPRRQLVPCMQTGQ